MMKVGRLSVRKSAMDGRSRSDISLLKIRAMTFFICFFVINNCKYMGFNLLGLFCLYIDC
jgi:hypothetical protein